MIIKKEQDEIQNYLKDASNYTGKCNAVYFPETEKDIQIILIEANNNKTPVTISGNRTGLTGSGVPRGGIVISTEKLDKILEINKNEKYVQLEPGVLLCDLQTELKRHNLFYPPDPTESTCFIGGTIATNASGARTFQYGPTRDYVIGLTIILADGEKLNIKRGNNFSKENKLCLTTEKGKTIEIELPDLNIADIKNAAGYFCKKNMDAIDLFIGSEGTLGVVSKIRLKIIQLSESKISCVVFFDDEKDGLKFIGLARKYSEANKKGKNLNSINALALEYFDKGTLDFLRNDFTNIPVSCHSAVWFEQETSKKGENNLLNEWSALIKTCNGNEDSCWIAINKKDENEIRKFRHSISEKINEYITGKGFNKLGTDVAVPDKYFDEIYNYAKQITEKERIKYANYGHFGNSHMHFNFLPASSLEYRKSKELYDLICKKAILLNGTVSAEHGIGKTKKHLFLAMLGKEIIDKMFEIKKVLDPNLILGQGNLF